MIGNLQILALIVTNVRDMVYIHTPLAVLVCSFAELMNATSSFTAEVVAFLGRLFITDFSSAVMLSC